MNPVTLALRALEFLFTIIAMALIGNIIAIADAGNPATINYSMFTVTFALLSLLYLLPSSVKESFSMPIVSIVLDGLNMLFLFCAAVALAAKLDGVHSCTNSSYIKSNEITNGSHNMTQRCREAQAADAFLWFAWAAFTATFVLSLLGGRSSSSLRPTIRRPGMSQV